MLLPASVDDNLVTCHPAEHPCGASALRGLACLTAHEPSSTVSLDEKGAFILVIYSLSWSRQDDFSLRGTLACRLTGASISDPADRERRVYLQPVKHL
jgi:hypothetical protein